MAEKFWGWLMPAGGTVIEETPSGKFHNGYDNQAGRDTLKFYIDLLYKDRVDSHVIEHDVAAFAQEKTAMFKREPWIISYMKEHAPKVNYGISFVPQYRRCASMTDASVFYVPKKAKYPQEAWDFIKFVTNKENISEFGLETGMEINFRKDIDFDTLFKDRPKFRASVKAVQEYDNFYFYPRVENVDEIYTKLASRLVEAYKNENLLNNPQGMAKFISDAAKETDDLLKEIGVYGEPEVHPQTLKEVWQ